MNAVNEFKYIECAKLGFSNNQIISSINTTNYNVYDIIDVYSERHLFILRKNDNEFVVFLSGSEMLNIDVLQKYIK